MSLFVSVIGPFGVGKTTITRYLADRFPSKFTAVYEDLSKNLFIDDVWNHNKNLTFEMQVNFISDVCEELKEVSNIQLATSNHILYDRALLETSIIYPVFQEKQQQINQRQKIVLFNLYNSIKEYFPLPDIYIYCKADPQVIFDRIKKRNRNHEKKVTKEQVTSLIASYDEVLEYENTYCFDLNTEQSLDNIVDDIEQIIHKAY